MALICPRAGLRSALPSLSKQQKFQLTKHPHRLFSQKQLHDIQKKQVQIYRSTSTNPYVNLSIEHHLLQHSHPHSTVLFLYVNRPCVVIGRNQNPWLETNLNLLRQGIKKPSDAEDGDYGNHTTTTTIQTVDLVRRRSGGGTVFHDEGNVNWSVICPPAAFDRRKHAHMVVLALSGLEKVGSGTVQVNKRHDIVLLDVEEHDDDGPGGRETATTTTTTYKISGSAYKLTRLRSLHHGTCLLSSPNLSNISRMLRSPAEPYIIARGVDSVRSKVRNAQVENEEFIKAVVDEFQDMYGENNDDKDGWVDQVVLVHEDSACKVPEIQNGLTELMSPEWIYGQTPLFTFSTHPTEEDPRPRPPLPKQLPKQLQILISARHGEIQEAKVTGLYPSTSTEGGEGDDHELLSQSLLKQKLHHIRDWNDLLAQGRDGNSDAVKHVGTWLNSIFCPLDGPPR